MTVFRTKCWNCNSSHYKETLMSEKCTDCGIEVHYSGSGMNDKAREAIATREWLEESKRIEEEFDWRYSNEWQQ